MDTQTVYIGTVETLSSGRTQDDRRAVEFIGEEVGRLTTYGYDDKRGRLTDTRGTTETLYRTEDGRLVVHVKDWSQWQGEPNTETLQTANETDLQPGGHFEALGAACGFGRPLTFDEAIERAGVDRAELAEYLDTHEVYAIVDGDA
jgi:hypothetical protein